MLYETNRRPATVRTLPDGSQEHARTYREGAHWYRVAYLGGSDAPRRRLSRLSPSEVAADREALIAAIHEADAARLLASAAVDAARLAFTDWAVEESRRVAAAARPSAC